MTTHTDPVVHRPLHRHAADYADGGRYPPPEPHPLGPLRPIVARWWLVLLITLVFVAGAVFVGMSKRPTYTSTASLNVGRTDVRVQALPGYVQGATSLAGSYSRIATSPQVEAPLARQLRIPVAEVHRRLTAVPIPANPFFTLRGTGSSPRDAIAFTRAATRQMQVYVTATDTGSQRVDDLLAKFRTATRQSERLQRSIAREKLSIIGTSSAKLSRLETDYEAAKLKADALKVQYQERSSELASTAGIQVISPAATAQSDRKRTVQRLGAVGLGAGLLVGAALALIAERAAAGRRRRQRTA